MKSTVVTMKRWPVRRIRINLFQFVEQIRKDGISRPKTPGRCATPIPKGMPPRLPVRNRQERLGESKPPSVPFRSQAKCLLASIPFPYFSKFRPPRRRSHPYIRNRYSSKRFVVLCLS